MNMLSVKVPFAGFYGSIWDQAEDSEYEQILENWKDCEDRDRLADLGKRFVYRPPTEHEWDIIAAALFEVTNHSKYRDYMARAYASEFASWLSASIDSPDMAFEFEMTSSPREYNFETDRLFAKFALSDLQRVYDTLPSETLAAVIADNCTSYDGFSSFYSADADDWTGKPLAEWDHNELGILMLAWIRHMGVKSIDDELWDWRCGGLYEEVGRACEAAIDWERLPKQVARDTSLLHRLRQRRRRAEYRRRDHPVYRAA